MMGSGFYWLVGVKLERERRIILCAEAIQNA